MKNNNCYDIDNKYNDTTKSSPPDSAKDGTLEDWVSWPCSATSLHDRDDDAMYL